MSTEIDVTACLAMRKRLNGKMSEGRISMNDIMLKAAAAALGRVPAVNATYLEGAVRRFTEAHIGFAVAIEEGLVTPVVRDCHLKGIGAIARESAALIDGAKSRRLKPRDMEGGTFTISNLGMYDVVEFSAIISPPQVGILAIARPVERAVVKNGWVVVRSMLNATLSADHRALDGVTGAEFLAAFKAVLQDPEQMLL
jgi:pyruvate dehydrogenase E2 component (dihydrolipoamide acetyltransferase)